MSEKINNSNAVTSPIEDKALESVAGGLLDLGWTDMQCQNPECPMYMWLDTKSRPGSCVGLMLQCPYCKEMTFKGIEWHPDN